MSVEFRGLDDVILALENLGDTQNIEAALTKACMLVEGEAKKKAPKDTGELRRSITSKVEGLEGIVYTPLEYAPYVEYGTGLFAENGGRKTGWAYEDEKTKEVIFTRGQRPQPFMRTALNENREEILRILGEGLIND